eukprot:2367945-Amphidinium_carterae.1
MRRSFQAPVSLELSVCFVLSIGLTSNRQELHKYNCVPSQSHAHDVTFVYCLPALIDRTTRSTS